MVYFISHKVFQFFLIIAFAIIFPGIAYGQIPGAPVYRDIKAYDARLTITDYNGRPFVNKYNDVEGSPFFIDYYCLASLKLNKGTVYENIPVKLDLCTHEVLVIDKNNKEIVPENGLVTDISLTDTASGVLKTYNFRAGYPSMDKKESFNFYQVLSDGRVQLLKFTSKEIAELKNIQSGEIRKEFVTRDEYYIFSGGKTQKLKKDREFIQELMTDKKEKINDYLKNNKVNFKNIDNLISLIGYYNSLTKVF